MTYNGRMRFISPVYREKIRAAAFALAMLVVCAQALSVARAGEEEDDYHGYEFALDVKQNARYSVDIVEITNYFNNDTETYHTERKLNIAVEVAEVKDNVPEKIRLTYDGDNSSYCYPGEEPVTTDSDLVGLSLVMQRGKDDVVDSPTGRNLGGALNRQWKLVNWDRVWLPSKSVQPKDTWKADEGVLETMIQYGNDDAAGVREVHSKVTFTDLTDNIASVELQADGVVDTAIPNYTVTVKLELKIKFDVLNNRMVSWEYKRHAEPQGDDDILFESTTTDTATGVFHYPGTTKD